jgi:hypothetical protein
LYVSPEKLTVAKQLWRYPEEEQLGRSEVKPAVTQNKRATLKTLNTLTACFKNRDSQLVFK